MLNARRKRFNLNTKVGTATHSNGPCTPNTVSRDLEQRPLQGHTHQAQRPPNPHQVKIVVAFYQCIFVLNTTFSVRLPASFTEWTGAIQAVGFDWLSFVLPTGCLIRGYHLRLVVTALAPIVLLLFKVVTSVTKSLVTKWRKTHTLPAALKHGLLAAVPFMLLDAFVSVSRRSGSACSLHNTALDVAA